MALYRSIGNYIFKAPLNLPTFSNSLCRTFASKHPGYRNQCGSNEPKCSEKSLKKKEEKGECNQEAVRASMWLNPECCINPCPDVLPRFDDLYYKPSDKSKRKYAQTWNECPEIRIAPRKICCYEKIKYPPMERRLKSQRPQTACPHVTEEETKTCALVGNKRCIKLRLPGCGPVRDPPKCFVIKPPSDCRKICTPYPSYSECNRPKPKPRHPVECNCLYVGPLCALK